MTPTTAELNELLRKLADWTKHDFHADRQLSDEVLIADGWNCEPDPTFEGGVRWFFGTNPQYSTGESGRPHPINDLNAAVGVVPFGYRWRLCSIGQIVTAHVWPPGEIFRDEFDGVSSIPTVALLIAIFKAKAAMR